MLLLTLSQSSISQRGIWLNISSRSKSVISYIFQQYTCIPLSKKSSLLIRDSVYYILYILVCTCLLMLFQRLTSIFLQANVIVSLCFEVLYNANGRFIKPIKTCIQSGAIFEKKKTGTLLKDFKSKTLLCPFWHLFFEVKGRYLQIFYKNIHF